MRKIFNNILLIFLSIGIHSYASNDSSGVVTGNLKLDNTWEPKVYLSVISNFNEMYTMSKKMIISQSPLDSLGNFHFNIGFLPEEESLLRIHIVKKGNPATTLVIGGTDENHFFFIANGRARINIQNIRNGGVFHGIMISGSPGTADFNRITELSNYPNMLNYDSILLEKEFLENAIDERLRSLADTCKNPVVSLYAVYKSGFESNYSENKEFYKSYLKKWEGNESTYFNAFRRQLPIKNSKWKYFFIISLIILSVIGLGIMSRRKKSIKMKKLSAQERKIFSLLQQGATNQEISNECHIELSTVKTHVSNIFSKLKIKSRKEILNMK